MKAVVASLFGEGRIAQQSSRNRLVGRDAERDRCRGRGTSLRRASSRVVAMAITFAIIEL